MPLMDEFKEERASIKNAPFKKKLRYFWDYYKWHVVVVIIVIWTVCSLVNLYLNKRELVFYTACINSTCLEADMDVYGNAFGEYLGIDTKKQECLFETGLPMDLAHMDSDSVGTTQKIMVYMSASDIDSIIATDNTLQHYAYLNSFCDLNEFLSAEELEKYDLKLYYMDQAVAREMKALADAKDYNTTVELPKDPYDPTPMKEPVAVGIAIEKGHPFYNSFHFSGEGPAILSIVKNTKHPETCHKLIEYLFSK